MKFSGVIERFVRYLDFDWRSAGGCECCQCESVASFRLAISNKGGVAGGGRRFVQRVA